MVVGFDNSHKFYNILLQPGIALEPLNFYKNDAREFMMPHQEVLSCFGSCAEKLQSLKQSQFRQISTLV